MNPRARFAPPAQAAIAKAVEDLSANPSTMRRLREALERAAELIGSHPAAGRREPTLADERYRFWSVTGFPYLLVYRPVPAPPLILRMMHTSRDLTPLLADLAAPDAYLPPN